MVKMSFNVCQSFVFCTTNIVATKLYQVHTKWAVYSILTISMTCSIRLTLIYSISALSGGYFAAQGNRPCLVITNTTLLCKNDNCDLVFVVSVHFKYCHKMTVVYLWSTCRVKLLWHVQGQVAMACARSSCYGMCKVKLLWHVQGQVAMACASCYGMCKVKLLWHVQGQVAMACARSSCYSMCKVKLL